MLYFYYCTWSSAIKAHQKYAVMNWKTNEPNANILRVHLKIKLLQLDYNELLKLALIIFINNVINQSTCCSTKN